MKNQTTELLEKLAVQLGTTAEYLWSVLLVQARISAMTDLIFLILAILSGYLLYRTHRYLSQGTEDAHSIYYEKEEAVMIPMIIGLIIWITFFLVMFFSIGNIISGLFNPEYWALNKILNSIR